MGVRGLTLIRVLACCAVPRHGATYSGDGLHELVLLQFEEDGGFSCTIQPQRHHPDFHLGADVYTVILEHSSVQYGSAQRFCSCSLDTGPTRE